MPYPNWPASRQALIILGLVGLQYFSWASHSRTLFNGLASPLFFVLTAYLVVLSTQYKVTVSPHSLLLFVLFAAWAVFTDARSGEFLPALAMDSHWFILPIATLLLTQVFREYPLAFQAIRVGAALCIINLLLTLFIEAEWYWHWRYPPIFGHIRHLGLSTGLLTIFLFAQNEEPAWVSAFFRACRILGLALVFWSGTRASILAWVFCVAIFTYHDRRWLKILLIDSMAAIALALIPEPPLPIALRHSSRSLTSGASLDALSTSRLTLWQSTLSGLNTIGGLWTGIGGNGFARLQVMHGANVYPPGHVHPHNVIVQCICDWGLIGLSLLTGFFGKTTVWPVVSKRKDNDPTALAAVMYLLVTGMLDATLYHLEHLNYLAIALAYLFSQKQARNANGIVLPAALVITLLLGLALIHAQTLDYRIGLLWYFPTR